MRVLILGAAGMLGHKLYQHFADTFETYATVRTNHAAYAHLDLFDAEHIIGGVDANQPDSIIRALSEVKPDVVINCIGIIKQLAIAKDPIPSITINALFPHKLALFCRAAGARMIHISTDCVFNGRGGMYTEDDPSDAEDLYGRTKFLGEVDAPGALTLRTSIIGRELFTRSGLVEWFLSNEGGQVRGFTNAIYTGFTTLALASIITDVIQAHPDLEGVYQVSSEPINKHDLLVMIRDAYNIDIEIEPYPDFRLDRSLDSSRFREVANFMPPSWSDMIEAMAHDPTPYTKYKD